MKTYVFPGQGSQSKGMGEALFDEFREYTDKADSILGYSIKDLCVNDPNDELGKTQFTQPALYVVNAFSYFKALNDNKGKPDFVAGHSLGEFNALLAAGAFSFETGLMLVRKRGELMSKASGGGMAAVINATKEQIESTLQENEINNVQLANYNSPKQIVISGLAEEIERAAQVLQQGRTMCIPLKTSGAFHSKFMQDAADRFDTFLRGFMFSKLSIPVISNVTAQPYENSEIISNLSAQITHSVRWSESIQLLLSKGEMEFSEMGNGNVLSKLIRDIKKANKA